MKKNLQMKKKSKKDEGLTEQLIHFSQEEETCLYNLVKELASKNGKPNEKIKEKLKKGLKDLLTEKPKAVDIALFGRMFADKPQANVEASVQVAHAISVHSVAVEDDFFTAVDDLNTGDEHSGSAHLGVTEFGAGLFYLYVCIDKKLLNRNLNGNDALAKKALSHLIECMATVAPTGKQNSFASRAYASYIRCEVGKQQPRSLSVAFLKPINKGDMLKESIKQLESEAERINKAYESVLIKHVQ